MENSIISVAMAIVQTVAYVYFLYSVTKILSAEPITKTKVTIMTISLLVCYIICTAVRSIVPVVNSIIFIICITLLCKFLFKINLLKSFLVAISNMALLAITEVLSLVISSVIFCSSYENLATSNIKLLFIIIIQALMSMGVIKLICLVFYKKLNFKTLLSNLTKKQVLILVIALIICIFPQMILFAINEYSYPTSFLLLNTIQFIVVCGFLFFYLKRTIEFEKAQSDLFTSELHNKTLVGMVDGVRTLKHDYNNIMQSLNGYVSTKQYDKLQDHINYVLGECNIVNNLSAIDPKIFNEPAIYGIVGSKFFLALEDDIKFDLDIATDISKIQFSMPDLSRILGILLDNAMEATKKCDTPYIRLEMKYDKRKCADVINVVNNYDTSININLEDIYKNGFSTKQVKSGIGLWEVKKLVNKQKNSQIFATAEKGKFTQHLIIEKID